MDLLIVGGDMRFALCAAMARADGWDVKAAGLEKTGVLEAEALAKPEDVPRAEALLLPNPFHGLKLEYADEPYTWSDVLLEAKPGARLLLVGGDGAPEDFWRRYDAADLLLDEKFARENARLTAEGAIHAAMGASERALCDSDCAVIGYGRVGASLARMLRGMGARVTVFARREQARSLAETEGLIAAPLSAMRSLLPEMRFVFSTPPARVLDDALSALRPGALLMDLASAPYGFELARARALGIRASREGALPGRYCAVSAAEALYRASFRALDLGEGARA